MHGLPVHDAEALGSLRRLQHVDALPHQLQQVLVPREDVALPLLFPAAGRQGGDEIVGLETLPGKVRDPQRLEDLQNPRDLGPEILGGLIAVGFVGRVALVAEGETRRVQDHGQVGGAALAQQLEQRAEKAENRRSVLPFGVGQGLADEGEVRTEDQAETVDQIQCFPLRGGIAHERMSTSRGSPMLA